MVDLTEQDLLTGLLHTAAFARRIDVLLADARVEGRPLAVIVAELPPIADDDVLTDAARRLRDVTRSRDVVARVGTGELAVCCPGADAAESAAVARRVAEVLAQPFERPEGRIVIRVAVGRCQLDVVRSTDTNVSVLFSAREALRQLF
jgi:diguanylate cyclase (GGDEF)-like protein